MLILPEPWVFLLKVVTEALTEALAEKSLKLLLSCEVRKVLSLLRFCCPGSPQYPGPRHLALLATILYHPSLPSDWLRPEGAYLHICEYFFKQLQEFSTNPKMLVEFLSKLPLLIAFQIPSGKMSHLPLGYQGYKCPDKQKTPYIAYKERIVLTRLEWSFERPICTGDNVKCTGAEIGELELEVSNPQTLVSYFLCESLLCTEVKIRNELISTITLALDQGCRNSSFDQVNAGEPDFVMLLLKSAGLEKMLAARGLTLERIDGLKLRTSPNEDEERWIRSCLQTHSARNHLVNAEGLAGWQPDHNRTTNDGVVWSVNLGGHKILGTLASREDQLYICTITGKILVRDHSGAEKGCFEPEEGVSFEAGPVVWNDKLVVVSREGHVLCFSPDAPDRRLSLLTPYGNCVTGFRFRHEPIIYDGIAYLACCGNPSSVLRVENLDNGSQAFHEILSFSDGDVVCSTPVMCRDGTLLVLTHSGKLYSLNLNPTSGPQRVRCIFKVSSTNNNDRTIGGVVCNKDGQYAFFSHQSHGIVLVDLSLSVPQGYLPRPASLSQSGTTSTMPIVVDFQEGATAYAATDKGYLLECKVTRPNGVEWNTIKICDQPISSRLATWKSLLFAVDQNGTIYAVNLRTKTLWWSYPTGHETRAPIWIDNDTGIIVVAGQDGQLTALRWYLNRPEEGVNLLEEWNEVEAAGNLAFVYKNFRKAKELWEQAQAELGLAILAECDKKPQAAIGRYQGARDRCKDNRLLKKIDCVIKELQNR